MGKSKSLIAILTISLLSLCLCFIGCSHELPDNKVPEKQVTLAEAVDKTQALIGSGLRSVAEQNAYNGSFVIELTSGENVLTLNTVISVNEENKDKTAFTITSDGLDIYYSSNVLYVKR